MLRFSFLPVLACLAPSALAAPQFPAFRTQEIDKSLKVGYAVVLRDINKDGKPDVVVCDANRVIWFDNAGDWKLHTITQGQVKPDNVCIPPAPPDVDWAPDDEPVEHPRYQILVELVDDGAIP